MRYYIGGDFFSDYGFWSDDFQNRMSKAVSFESVLKGLNYPSLYFSYKRAFQGAGQWVRSKAWEKFEAELRNIEQQDYVKKVITVEDAKFVVTGPK